MYTKSKIQLIRESLRSRNEFKEMLNNLMDKYIIEDSIFAYHGDNLFEVVDGYFVPCGEYNNIQEALENCDSNNKAVRIINNEKFAVGEIYEMLSMCHGKCNVLDINKLEEIG